MGQVLLRSAPTARLCSPAPRWTTCSRATSPSFATRPPAKLDPTFSGDGIQTINALDDNDGASGVVVQPSDGKIVAVGRSAGFDRTFTAMRLKVDGTARRRVRFGRCFPHEHRGVLFRHAVGRRSSPGRNDPRGGNRRRRRGPWRLRARALPARRSARPRVRRTAASRSRTTPPTSTCTASRSHPTGRLSSPGWSRRKGATMCALSVGL